MYEIDLKKISYNIREYRKINHMTLEELGRKIGKTKATVGKYETGEIVIDIITLLEICNIFNIDFNSICNINSTIEKSTNPFSSKRLYLYYISRNGLLISEIELEERSNSINVIMKNVLTQRKDKPYLQEYVGVLESNLETAFICLTNAINNPGLDKFQIEIDLRSKNDDMYLGAFLGIANYTHAPTARKCIITSKKIMEKEKLKEIFNKLKVTKEEAQEIEETKYWDFKTRNFKDYIIDIEK